MRSRDPGPQDPRSQDPEPWDPANKTQDPGIQAGSRNPEPRTRNPGPKISRPITQDLEPGTPGPIQIT